MKINDKLAIARINDKLAIASSMARAYEDGVLDALNGRDCSPGLRVFSADYTDGWIRGKARLKEMEKK